MLIKMSCAFPSILQRSYKVSLYFQHNGILCEGGFKEGESKAINLAIKTEILEICLKYLHYKLIYRNVSFERPPFKIAPEHALEVLKAAMYLQC
jgi:hypothetical protein